MNYKISKELFEAVHGRKVDEHTDLRYKGFLSTLVVNDFFFKCKEWALEQGYILESSFKDTSICVVYRIINDGWSKTKETSFSRSSEQQAVFNACQWLLDNKDKQ